MNELWKVVNLVVNQLWRVVKTVIYDFNYFFGLNWQNIIFYLLIVGLFVFAVRKEWRATKRYQRNQKSKISIIDDALKYLSKNLTRVKGIGRETVNLDFENIPKHIRKEIFNWVSEHLAGIERNGTFQAQLQSGRFVLVQYPTILEKPVPRSSLRFIQSILIALGVLGTFFGIQVGLRSISLSDIGQNSGHLLKSSVQLLEGMKTAFSTSLVGLGLSSIFTLFLAFCERERQQDRDRLKSQLDSITILETPMRLFERMNPEANLKASQALANAAETMGTKFAELIEIQRQLSPKAIGQEVGNVIKPVLQEIQVELTALREIKADQGQEILKNLIEEQREQLIKPIITELSNSAKLTKQASEAVMDLKNELGSVSRSLSESIITIERFQSETLEKLQQFATNLEAILGEFRNDTKNVMQQVATEVKTVVNESILAMQNQRTAFESSAEKAAATFAGIREELEKSLNTQAEIQQQSMQQFQNYIHEIFAEQNNNLQQLGEQSSEAMRVQRDALTKIAKQTISTFIGIREELEQSLQTQAQIERELIQEFQNRSLEIFDRQANNLSQVGNAASQQMNEAKENLNSTLSNIDSVLQNTRLTVQGELENFRINYQAALQEFFSQQNQLLEGTLGEQRQGLANVVENFKGVFEEEYHRRTAFFQEIQETTKVVSNLANTIGLSSSERLVQLKELAETIGDEASRVDKAYQNLTDKFNQALGSWNKELVDYFQRKSEFEMNFFTKADAATEKVCHQLLQAANYLVAAENTRKVNNEEH
ncbi:hypothetical protein ACE1B6_07055 [Aerosakkonemataceae cyanobacterium BLCC-F154]|uniref:MotA/TolQ/ExbB proton channel domain-containing protein n=1 Tax=Floridaenema fluviatile BLCC-F154 TaxID=3153640 RepID=A0ABV4Y892_9CYAN